MLENSYLHEGLESKEIEKLLKEYQDLTVKLTDLDETKKSVLKRLYELSQVGVNETRNYVYSISLVNGRRTISVSELQKNAPELLKRISGLGFLSVGEDYKVIKGIKEKGDRS